MKKDLRLDSKQCEAFLAVIDGGSFEQAAQALHLTVSAISQRVKALEMQLGRTLLVRARPCRASHAGQKLLQHLRRVSELEQDLNTEFEGDANQPLSFALAVNADSLDSWVLPALSSFLQEEHIQIAWTIDDQDHTHDLLENGTVLGCISSESRTMRGCQAIPLGIMRYYAAATSAFHQRWFADGVHRAQLLQAPLISFNRKDKLQSLYLQHFGLQEDDCPRHFIPATSAYNQAIQLGLGWGMMPEIMLAPLPENQLLKLSQHAVDVMLYWQHWKVQTPRLANLSTRLQQQAMRYLRQ